MAFTYNSLKQELGLKTGKIDWNRITDPKTGEEKPWFSSWLNFKDSKSINVFMHEDLFPKIQQEQLAILDGNKPEKLMKFRLGPYKDKMTSDGEPYLRVQIFEHKHDSRMSF